MKRSLSVPAAGAAAALLLGVTAACSSSSSSTTAAGASAAASTSTGASASASTSTGASASGKTYNLTKDPEGRAIGGASSGAICAWMSTIIPITCRTTGRRRSAATSRPYMT